MWACTTHIAQYHLPAEHYFEKHFNRIISIRSFKNTPTGGHIKGYCDEMSLQNFANRKFDIVVCIRILMSSYSCIWFQELWIWGMVEVPVSSRVFLCMCGTKQPVKFLFKWAKKMIKPARQKERKEDKIVVIHRSCQLSLYIFLKISVYGSNGMHFNIYVYIC